MHRIFPLQGLNRFLFPMSYTQHQTNYCSLYCHCPDLSSSTRRNIKTDFADDKKDFILKN